MRESADAEARRRNRSEADGVMKEFDGERVVVMGLGLFGGGEGAARFFAERGARVLVTDLRPESDLRPALERLSDLPGVSFRLGGHDTSDFLNADVVVVNPAVPDDAPALAAARDAGVRLTTEMNLFFERCGAPIVGVTGTNGKSTTAALCHAFLRALGFDARLGGNIGGSLLSDVDDLAPPNDDRNGNVVVLELSSFQLERLRWTRKSPEIAVVLNLAPNHLDRHKTMEAYAEAKAAILDHQRPEDFAVLNAGDSWYEWFRVRARGRVRAFAAAPVRDADVSAVLDGGTLRLRTGAEDDDGPTLDLRAAVERLARAGDGWRPGSDERPPGHNAINCLAAATAVCAALLRLRLRPREDELQRALESGLAAFEPLEHRLERVAEVEGVLFVNDSIATNPESVLAALDAFADRRVALIAGGHDKGLNYDALAKTVCERVRRLVLLESEGATKIMEAVRRVCGGRAPETTRASDMNEAVRAAAEAEAEVVLLSPACASYGMFRNFEERGRAFREAVARLVGVRGT